MRATDDIDMIELRNRSTTLSADSCRQQRLPKRESQLGNRARTADQKALGLLAPGCPHELQLLFGLDAFGCRHHVELAPEICDGANDRGAITAIRHFPDERLVDLDLVEGK